MKTKTRSVLLKTSSGNDVQYSGGKLSITGLADGIRYNDILDFKQIKQRAEVVRVSTVTVVAATAPTVNTTYTISIKDPNRKGEGWTGYSRKYAFTTPPVLATMGATAAFQNEYITTKLVAAINADSSNFVSAASLLLGTGFTITDDAGYYPARLNGGSGGRKGTSSIVAITNSDGTGYVQSQIADTTRAVYSFGDGTRMLQDMPVLHAYSGNIISGEYDAPTAVDGTFAVSGQLYDAFYINSLCTQAAHAVTDQIAHALQTDIVFYDNGKGTSTTNLAGSITFEREMLKDLFNLYDSNNASVIEWFDQDFIIQGPLGAVPVTTTATNNSLAVYNKFMTAYGELDHRNIGTQTIVAPTQGPAGLLIDQDVATGDGAHYSPSLSTLNGQQFVVGKTDFSVYARFSATAVTGADFQVGFHEKNVFFLDFNNYINLATVGTLSTAGDITTRGILANAATVITSSTDLTVNSVTSEFIVKVAIDGTVTCIVNNKVYPIYSAGTTPLKFAAGTVLVPFFQSTQITGTASVGVISAFVSVANTTWRA